MPNEDGKTNPDNKHTLMELLPISTIGGFEFIEKKTISYLEASGNYTRIFFEKKQQAPLLASMKIGVFESILKDDPFLRVHRGFIINLNKLRQYVRHKQPYVILKEDHCVQLSDLGRTILLQVLKAKSPQNG